MLTSETPNILDSSPGFFLKFSLMYLTFSMVSLALGLSDPYIFLSPAFMAWRIFCLLVHHSKFSIKLSDFIPFL